MTDIVERLRDAFNPRYWTSEIRTEAADEIERLRAAHKEAYELAYGVARHDCEAEIERLRADNEFLVESVEKHVAAGIRLGERAKEAEDEIERLRELIANLPGLVAEIERLRHRCRELDFALTELLEEKTDAQAVQT